MSESDKNSAPLVFGRGFWLSSWVIGAWHLRIATTSPREIVQCVHLWAVFSVGQFSYVAGLLTTSIAESCEDRRRLSLLHPISLVQCRLAVETSALNISRIILKAFSIVLVSESRLVRNSLVAGQTFPQGVAASSSCAWDMLRTAARKCSTAGLYICSGELDSLKIDEHSISL